MAPKNKRTESIHCTQIFGKARTLFLSTKQLDTMVVAFYWLQAIPAGENTSAMQPVPAAAGGPHIPSITRRAFSPW